MTADTAAVDVVTAAAAAAVMAEVVESTVVAFWLEGEAAEEGVPLLSLTCPFTWTAAAGVWLTTAAVAVVWPLAVRAGRMAGVAAAAAVVVVAVLFCCCRIIRFGFVDGFEFPAAVDDDETTSRVCALIMILCVCPAAAITWPCDTAIS